MRWIIRIIGIAVLLALLSAGGLTALYLSARVEIPDLTKSSHIDGFAAPGLSDELHVKASARLEQLRAEIGYPSVSVAVASIDQVLWAQARGWASIESQTPATRNTAYAVGSVSKVMTALVALRLSEQGKLDLDADVRNYLPNFPKKEFPFTARQLLSHQAGIRHYALALSWPTFSEFGSNVQYQSVADSLQPFAADPLLFKPDTKFSYSSHGFTLVAAAMERAGGKPFLDLMQQELFTPLDLKNSGGDDKRRPDPQRASDYQNMIRDGFVLPSPPTNSSGKWAGGGFKSTPLDLATMGQALLSGRIISRETMQIMFTPRTLAGGQVNPQNYGLGIRIDNITDPAFPGKSWRVVHHGGVAVGSQAMFVAMPDHGLIVALCANATTQPPARGMFDAATDLAILFAEARAASN